MKNQLTLILLLIMSFQANAIVVIDNLKFDDENLGFNGTAGIDFKGTDGNTKNSAWKVDSSFYWRKSDYINFVLMGYDYGKSKDTVNMDKSFIHARHIRKTDTFADWEMFTQLEKNEFTRLSSRGLVGTGMRMSAGDNSFVGLGGLYFDERLNQSADNIDEDDDGFRVNAYWNGNYKYNDHTSFKTQLYYQPKVDEFSDFRVLFESSLKVNITDRLAVKFSLDIVHDNKPPQGIEKTDYSYSSGFVYSF